MNKPHERIAHTDTSPEARQVLDSLMRTKQPWEKLRLVSQLNYTMRVLMMTGIRERHRELTQSEARRRLFDQLLGPALAGAAFGPLE